MQLASYSYNKVQSCRIMVIILILVFPLYRFWSLLSPFCTTSVIKGLPLVSSFGRGYGHNLTIDGKVRIYLKVTFFSG